MSSAAERVRDLRELIGGLSQDKLAADAGLERTEVVKIEGGQNQARSDRIRRALAKGFGLLREDLDALLDGTIDVAEAHRRRGRARHVEGELPEALVAVLESEEARRWSARTRLALEAIGTKGDEPLTEEQWLTLGRGYEITNAAIARPVLDDPVAAAKAAKRRGKR